MIVRIVFAFILAPWVASLSVAAILSMYPTLRFDGGVFWFYLMWLGVGGQVLSAIICAPVYLVARRLTELTFSKIVIGAGLAVGVSVSLLSLVASSQGMRMMEGFGLDLVGGSLAYGLMGAIGGAVFWLVTREALSRTGSE